MLMSTTLELVIGAVLGTVFSILTTIFMEWFRRPRLEVKLIEPRDLQLRFEDPLEGKAQPIVENVRFLTVHVENRQLPKGLRWMNRNTAVQCRGSITFHHRDGQNVFGRVMQGRWAGIPEPVFPWFVYAGNKTTIIDPSRLFMDFRMDIRPGTREGFDVAIRYQGEDVCYGWNNESYISNPRGKNSQWQLKPGIYLVRIRIETAECRVSEKYRLINDVGIQDFRLIPAQKGDIIK